MNQLDFGVLIPQFDQPKADATRSSWSMDSDGVYTPLEFLLPSLEGGARGG